MKNRVLRSREVAVTKGEKPNCTWPPSQSRGRSQHRQCWELMSRPSPYDALRAQRHLCAILAPNGNRGHITTERQARRLPVTFQTADLRVRSKAGKAPAWVQRRPQSRLALAWVFLSLEQFTEYLAETEQGHLWEGHMEFLSILEILEMV